MSSDESHHVTQKKRVVAGVFSRAAPTYDRVGPRFFSHFGHRLVELAQIPKGARVLDVATGKGAVLFPAADAVGPLGHVTGVDLSQAMVDEIAEEISRQKLMNVEVRQMDAEYLQFPDASFDCILCGFAIFFFPQLDRAISEMRRVLRPNGRIAITTWDRLLDEEWKWFSELVKAHLPPEPETKQTPESQSPPPPVLDRPDGLEMIMKAAGFADAQVISETAEFVYTSEEVWWSALWSHGTRASMEKVEKAIGSNGLNRFKADVFERLGSVKQSDGIHELFPVLFTLVLKPGLERVHA